MMTPRCDPSQSSNSASWLLSSSSSPSSRAATANRGGVRRPAHDPRSLADRFHERRLDQAGVAGVVDAERRRRPFELGLGLEEDGERVEFLVADVERDVVVMLLRGAGAVAVPADDARDRHRLPKLALETVRQGLERGAFIVQIEPVDGADEERGLAQALGRALALDPAVPPVDDVDALVLDGGLEVLQKLRPRRRDVRLDLLRRWDDPAERSVWALKAEERWAARLEARPEAEVRRDPLSLPVRSGSSGCIPRGASGAPSRSAESGCLLSVRDDREPGGYRARRKPRPPGRSAPAIHSDCCLRESVRIALWRTP